MSDDKKDFARGDITWVEHPTVAVKEKKRGQRRAAKTFKSRIPRILRELAPATVFDPQVAWKRQRIADGAAVAAAVAVSEKELKMKQKLDMQRALERYETDGERIRNKMKEGGITSLLSVRSNIVTKRGELEMMLEILRLAAKDKANVIGAREMTDPIVALDVMWAIRENRLFKECIAELAPKEEARAPEEAEASADPARDFQKRLNDIIIPLKKMNVGDLTKECTARNVDIKNVKVKKDTLFAALRKKIEDDLKSTDSAPVAAAAVAAPVAAPVSLRPEALMVQTYKDVIAKVEAQMLADPDITATQMTSMAHLLPPLSPFYQVWDLDEWQKKALRYIDDNKSVLICAPTSSGKTVISSYVASMFLSEANSVAGNANADESSDDEDEGPTAAAADSRILFVVPTEPLVWQVAAHFAKFLSVDTKVALVTEQMSFTPAAAQIVVGTPAALESAMTKIRGKDGSTLESTGAYDGSILHPGYGNYRWAVYDEVHSLNSESPDGAALQRLIRMVNCPFLCLSATVGNAENLRSWLSDVRGDQRGIEIVEAPPQEDWEEEVRAAGGQEAVDAAEQSRLVKKIQHAGRFINLQRHVWAASDGSPRGDHLELLSPLSAVSTAFLQEDGFKKCSLPMTPLDAFNTWLKLKEFFPIEAVEELEPKVFFSFKFERENEIPSRLTLKNSKEYEDAIKSKLVVLSRTYPDAMDRMLSQFVIPSSPPDFDSIPPQLATKDSPARYGDMTELIWKLKADSNPSGDMLPALVFHLDLFELFDRFKSLLGGLEVMQKTMHPNMHRDLEEKRKLILDEMQHDLNEANGDKEKDEIRQRYAPRLASVDIEQPHQDYVLSRRISMDEIKDIVADMTKYDKFQKGTQVMAHALIRGLRRGIAMVVNHVSFQAYRRAVLRLAMQGKLAVVFSDVSLAYGVNMPFRSCIFCGDMGGQLDALMLQQMSGRAGRRGMDTQGHLIYAGTNPQLINDLTLGVIPAIKGIEYRYHTQNLQYLMSGHVPPRTPQILSSPSLAEFITHPEHVDNFDELSTNTLLKLKLILKCRKLTPKEILDDGFDYTFKTMENDPDHEMATPSGYRPNGRKTAMLWMVWELRANLPESILAGFFLPILLNLATSRTKTTNYGQDEEDQFEFMAILMMLINRTPCGEGKVPLWQHQFIAADGNKRREEMRVRMLDCTVRLAKVRDEYLADIPRSEMVMFPLAGAVGSGDCNPDLDSTFFAAFYAGNASFVPKEELHMLMGSIWHVGNTLLKMYNSLWPDTAKYGKLRFVISKCHARLNYLVREILAAHIDMPNVTLPDTI